MEAGEGGVPCMKGEARGVHGDLIKPAPRKGRYLIAAGSQRGCQPLGMILSSMGSSVMSKNRCWVYIMK